MRLTVLVLGGALGVLASAAWAGPASPLLEGIFHAGDSQDPAVACNVNVSGATFLAAVQVEGFDESVNFGAVSLQTAQPTSVSRSEGKISVKQGEFAALTFEYGFPVSPVDALGGVPLAKCSLTSSFNPTGGHASASASCKGDDLSALMSADAIVNFKAVMANHKHAKLSVDSADHKWSLSIHCSGPTEI